jgi:hypothetical protein
MSKKIHGKLNDLLKVIWVVSNKARVQVKALNCKVFAFFSIPLCIYEEFLPKEK